ncbi:MAG: hypothetical protein KJZ86_13320 [Caldilineaceae bacterium]|nr:hypothetical protein [Caldilineaceae bacterium]
MPTLSYTEDTRPKSSEEFQRRWAEVVANSNPIDDLLEVAAELRCFETKYEMSSKDFCRRFNAGEIGDDFDFFDWNASYRMYLSLRKAIDAALMRSAVVYTAPITTQKEPELEPAPA